MYAARCEFCRSPACFTVTDVDHCDPATVHPQVCALHLGDWLKNDLAEDGRVRTWRVSAT